MADDFVVDTSMAAPRGHPLLSVPKLYIANLDAKVTKEDLFQCFHSVIPFRPTLDQSKSPVEGFIDFKELAMAEKALATLNNRPLHPTRNIGLVHLFAYLPDSPPSELPTPNALPRLVSQLPGHYFDPFAPSASLLYDLFRPFGPIYNARVSRARNARGEEDEDEVEGIVEFWREEDAMRAEEAMHCADVHGRNIAVKVIQQGANAGHGGQNRSFSAHAPVFVPGGVAPYGAYHQPTPPYTPSPPHLSPYTHTPSPPHQGFYGSYPNQQSPYSSPSSRRTSGPFTPGPGQQVQFGSGSHSGLIDPCNLFCKNLDPDIDSNALFQHFHEFGQIVSARVMRDDSGRSRGFGFVSYQTPTQATAALKAMDGRVLGSKQVVVRLHEPKQLRQEKLAKRFANSSSSSSSPGASHPGSPSPPTSQFGLYPNSGYGYGQPGYGGRSRSGATSPTASESGFSVVNWQGQSPRAGYQALGLNISGDRPRRGSGSYYNAALQGQLNMPLTSERLQTITPVMRNEIVMGELQRRVRGMDLGALANIDANREKSEIEKVAEADALVDALLALNLNLGETAAMLNEKGVLEERVRSLLGVGTNESDAQREGEAEVEEGEIPEVPQAASAPEHPSTPVSIVENTPPRTESPSGSIGDEVASASAGAQPPTTSQQLPQVKPQAKTEREKMGAVLRKLVPSLGTPVGEQREEELLGLLMSLGKRERAMCLFSDEVLRTKVIEALAVLELGDEDEEAPVTQKQEKTQAPGQPSPQAITQPHYTLQTLARLPCTQILDILRSADSGSQALKDVGMKAEDAATREATDTFMDTLEANPSVRHRKQKLGDRLFKVLKGMEFRGVPKLVIALLDNEDLRALAHMEASYPAILKEKAGVYHANANAAK